MTTVTSKTAGLSELPALKPMDDARVNAAIRGKIVDEKKVEAVNKVDNLFD